MRRIAFAFCILAAIPLHGAKPRIVVTPLVHLVCEANTACTKFEDSELECDCVTAGKQWKAEAKVTSRPVVYLSDMRYLLHEASHIFDFDEALRRHEREIEAKAFDSREACLTFTTEVLAGFMTLMRNVERDSMRLRDPGVRRHHAGE